MLGFITLRVIRRCMYVATGYLKVTRKKNQSRIQDIRERKAENNDARAMYSASGDVLLLNPVRSPQSHNVF